MLETREIRPYLVGPHIKRGGFFVPGREKPSAPDECGGNEGNVTLGAIQVPGWRPPGSR